MESSRFISSPSSCADRRASAGDSPRVSSPPGRHSSACTIRSPSGVASVSGRAHGKPLSASARWTRTQVIARPLSSGRALTTTLRPSASRTAATSDITLAASTVPPERRRARARTTRKPLGRVSCHAAECRSTGRADSVPPGPRERRAARPPRAAARTPRPAAPARGPGRDRERGDRAEADGDRADQDRRVHAVDERLTALVAALAGEDRRQHRDAEDAAELADRVVGARRDPLLLRPHGREDEVRDRGEEQRHARSPAMMNGADQLRIRRVRRRRPRPIHAERDRLQREPDADDQLRRDPVGQRAGDRRDEHRRQRPRQDPQPGAEAASSPARSGRTARAGRSSRTCRST